MVWTNTVQAIVMMGGILIIIVFVSQRNLHTLTTLEIP